MLSRQRFILSLVLVAVYAASAFYIATVDSSIVSERGYPIHNGGDSGEYATLAANIAEHGTFSLTLDPRTPEMFRSPGYPLFLAPLYAVDRSFTLAVILQILLTIGSALLIVKIGQAFLPKPWPLVAALVYALNPTTIFYTVTLWSEPLYIFLTLLGVYLMTQSSVSWRIALVAGVIMGYATLVRSAGGMVALTLIAVVTVAMARTFSLKRALVTCALFICAYIAITLPWYVRNYEESGAIGLSTTGPYTLLLFHVRDFELGKGVPAADFDRELQTRLNVSDANELKSISYSSATMEIVKEKIFADPVNYGIYHGLGIVNFFLSSSVRDAAINLPLLAHALTAAHLIGERDVSIKALLKEDPIDALRQATLGEPLLTLERIVRMLLVILVGVGVVALFLERRLSAVVVVSLLIVLYTAAVIGPVSYPRYRMSAEPFLLLLGGAGAAAVLRWRSHRPSATISES